MTWESCHMACLWHSVQDNGAWVYAWFCPLGRDDRNRACLFWFCGLIWSNCSVAIAFIVDHGALSGLQRIRTIPRQGRTEEGLLLLLLSDKGRGKVNKLRDLGSKDGEASVQPGCHKRVQWSMFMATANNNSRNQLCFKELMSSCFIFCKYLPEVPRWCHALKQLLKGL